MKTIVILFGVVIVLMAGMLIVRPRELSGFMLGNAGKLWFQGIAVATRILLGIVLIRYADFSRYPLVLFILGWIAIVAGIALAILPRAKFRALVHWAFERFGRYLRVAALAALLFGAFLIYAVT